MRTSESRDTSNSMILVPLLNPKLANTPAARSCELRVRGTSRLASHRELEALDESIGEGSLPVNLGLEQSGRHHVVVGRLPARLGDDAEAHGLGVAAVEHLERLHLLDAEGDLLIGHFRIVDLDQRIRRRRVADVALPAL